MGCLRPEPPTAARALLVRERLLERLRRRWLTPVTVLSAPAGYGKTTLLSQAIAANAEAPLGSDCWLACGPDTTTASALAEALARAVGVPPRTPGRGGVGELVAPVLGAMWRRSPQQVAVLVDDVHEIPPGSDAAQLLARLVASLPANGHVVLAGRLPPPLALARLEVEGRVTRLDEADLAFTGAELAEFAALRGVPDTRVASCGGWPALAELSASGHADVADDYVGQEVLSRMRRERRRDLALLAHVGPFDDELAAAVLGPGRELPRVLAGLPLVTVTPGGDRMLHGLWQTLLAGDAPQSEVAAARQRAARVLLGRGRAAAAVRLLIDAEAGDELADVIVGCLGAAHPPVAHDVLADWLARLPEAVRTGPSGRLLAAVVAADADPDGAWGRLEECAAAFRAQGHATGELACLVQLGQLAWWTEVPDRLAGLAMRLFELEAAGCDEAVPLACLGRALIYDIQNDSARTLAELDRIPPGSLSGMWLGIVATIRSTSLNQLGYAREAVESAEEALGCGGSPYEPLIEAVRLQALWYAGETATVLAALPDLFPRIKDIGRRHHVVVSATQLCLALALQGRADEAAVYLAHGRAHAVSTELPLVDTLLSVAEAAVAVARGDEAVAARVLSAYLTRHRLDEGLSAAQQRRSLALIYVLVPEARAVWDRAGLGPGFAVARDLARALSAVRERHCFPPDAPPLPGAALVQAHLPLPWMAELAVAAVAAGRADGTRLLEETWPATRPTVAALAQEPRGPLGKAARATLARLAAPPTGRLELRLLGPLELRCDGVPVDAADWRRERVRSLLAYLALHRTVSRQQLADDLWPALDAEAQSRNLRVTLTYLLRVLEPERAHREASFFVRPHGGNLAIHTGEWLDVDVWDFDDACDRAEEADRCGAPATALAQGLRAVEAWRGEPTELASEPWAVTLLERRRLRFAAAATRTGELLLARGDGERARALAERALTVDPWMEAPHRLVVASHHAAGDDLAARRALGRYRQVIGELGLGRDETTLMVERLVDGLPRRTGPSGSRSVRDPIDASR